MANCVGPGDIRQRLASLPSRQGLLPLMLRKGRLPTELHASNLRSLPAFGSPGQDQMPLKLRKAAKDRKHQLAMWRGAVCPGIAKGAEASPGFVNRRQGVEQITSAQPI